MDFDRYRELVTNVLKNANINAVIASNRRYVRVMVFISGEWTFVGDFPYLDRYDALDVVVMVEIVKDIVYYATEFA